MTMAVQDYQENPTNPAFSLKNSKRIEKPQMDLANENAYIAEINHSTK